MMVKRTMVVTLALAAQVLFGADGELPVGTWQPKFYPGLEAAGNVQTVAKGFKGKFDTIRLAWESGAKTFGVKREVTTDLKGVVDWTVEALVKSEGEAGEVGAAMEFFDAKGQSLGIVRSKRPAYSPEWRRTIWNFTGPKAACRQEIHLLSLDVDPVQLCQMSVKSRQGVDKGELEFDVMALPSEWNRDWNGGDNRMLNFSDAPIPVVFLLKGPGAQREGLQLVVDIPAELEIKDACCPYRKAFEPLKPSATPFVTNGTAFVRYVFEKAKVFEALHVSGYNADESVGIMLTVGPKAGGEKAEKSYRIAYRMVQKGRFGTEKAMTMAFRPLPTGLKLSKNFRVFSWNSSDRHFATDAAALAAFRAYEAAGLATFRKTGNGSRPNTLVTVNGASPQKRVVVCAESDVTFAGGWNSTNGGLVKHGPGTLEIVEPSGTFALGTSSVAASDGAVSQLPADGASPADASAKQNNATAGAALQILDGKVVVKGAGQTKTTVNNTQSIYVSTGYSSQRAEAGLEICDCTYNADGTTRSFNVGHGAGVAEFNHPTLTVKNAKLVSHRILLAGNTGTSKDVYPTATFENATVQLESGLQLGAASDKCHPTLKLVNAQVTQWRAGYAIGHSFCRDVKVEILSNSLLNATYTSNAGANWKGVQFEQNAWGTIRVASGSKLQTSWFNILNTNATAEKHVDLVFDGGVLEMEVRAVISVAPLKEELVFRARLNMETGESIVTTSEDR